MFWQVAYSRQGSLAGGKVAAATFGIIMYHNSLLISPSWTKGAAIVLTFYLAQSN